MPRHDESHVAIPMLAGLLLLVGGCAGQMAGPPWDNVTGDNVTGATAPRDNVTGDSVPWALDVGVVAAWEGEWSWGWGWDWDWDWDCGPPPSGAGACAPGAFGGPADPVFGPVRDALHGHEIHRLWDPVPGGM